jgi:glutaredoxin 3
MNTEIIIYTKSHCPNCTTAKMVLDSFGLKYEEKNMDDTDRFIEFQLCYPEARQMPQIFINRQRVGGLAGLQAALKQIGSVPL